MNAALVAAYLAVSCVEPNKSGDSVGSTTDILNTPTISMVSLETSDTGGQHGLGSWKYSVWQDGCSPFVRVDAILAGTTNWRESHDNMTLMAGVDCVGEIWELYLNTADITNFDPETDTLIPSSAYASVTWMFTSIAWDNRHYTTCVVGGQDPTLFEDYACTPMDMSASE